MNKYMKRMVMTLVMIIAVGVQGYAQPHHRYHHPRPSYGYGYGYYHRPYYRPYYRPLPSYYYWNPAGYWYYAPLSVYWWGNSWDTPTKIKIEVLEFKRTSSGRLRIKNGTEPKFYLDLYKDSHLRYTCPSGTKVDVQTGNGDAKITVYGKDGKTTASYTL